MVTRYNSEEKRDRETEKQRAIIKERPIYFFFVKGKRKPWVFSFVLLSLFFFLFFSSFRFSV